MKTVKFYTLGCKVNQYDTQSIREQFIRAGFQELDDSQPSDIYVINTCTVTHHADADSLNLIRWAKNENPKAKIIATGCLTELDEDRIKNIDKEILIAKNKDKNTIIDLLTEHPTQLITYNLELITYFKSHTRAFLKIQDGCNNFCSYCKVPLVRGRSRSKPLDAIVREARQLVKNDFKEIVLSGVCLGGYGKDLKSCLSLIDVLDVLEKIEGLLRIRLSSIEAGDVSDELICKMAHSKKLCRHLHIPLQSGDDEILKKMNRNYSRKDFLNLMQRIKKRIPGVAITTDVLIGFPGENESHFQNTITLVQEISPLKTHIFPYSKRESTAAWQYCQDEIGPVIIKDRLLRIKNIAKECGLAYKIQFLGKVMTLLIEQRCKENLDFWQGYTDNYIQVRVKSKKNLKNEFIPLKLKQIDKNFILADFISQF